VFETPEFDPLRPRAGPPPGGFAIHLVQMPFGSGLHPSLPLGLLKALLTRAGVRARVYNLNLEFAGRIGFPLYESLAQLSRPHIADWLFARAAFGEGFEPPGEDFLTDYVDEAHLIKRSGHARDFYVKLRDQAVEPYLDDCVRALAAEGPIRTVGFTCTFYETLSSLALGRRLKEKDPSITTVYGGACFHGEMGLELIRGVPWIDVVSVGEADDVAVELVRRLAARKAVHDLPGIYQRGADGKVRGTPAEATVDLDRLPTPDYDEFFQDGQRIGLVQRGDWRREAFMPFEASRGCWWGMAKHCTFCGLNADTMDYRARSAERTLETLAALASRYGLKKLHAVDNILRPGSFKDVLPALAERGAPYRIFYEVKSNLTRGQIEMLWRSGVVEVQPGIESLSSHILELMRKGVTGIHNVSFLKWCRYYGVNPGWNMLMAFPGEVEADYRRQMAWCPKLVHLKPPAQALAIELHRFSPYFKDRTLFPISEIRAHAWYAHLFPRDRLDLDKVAYYFSFKMGDTVSREVMKALSDACVAWKDRWDFGLSGPPRLDWRIDPEGEARLAIEDSREPNRRARKVTLEGLRAAVYLAVDDATTDLAKARRRLADVFEGRFAAADEAEVRAALDELVAADLVLREGDLHLGLAVPAGPPKASAPLHPAAERAGAPGAPAATGRRGLPMVTTTSREVGLWDTSVAGPAP